MFPQQYFDTVPGVSSRGGDQSEYFKHKLCPIFALDIHDRKGKID